MPAQTTNYQCPACTGPMHFDSALGKLKCDYCDSTYTVEEVEELFRARNEAAEEAKPAEEQIPDAEFEADWDISGIKSDWQAEDAKLSAYNCTSCGAELICDSTTAATTCPYCGNNTIIPGKFAGALKPDYIIPFQMSKEQAEAALLNYYKGKRLLPKLFSKQNHIEEIQGIYVPFWLYDGRAEADMTFGAQIVTTRETKTEEITDISFFDLYRRGNLTFEKIPVDGSSKMADDLMDSIEPFDYTGLRPFSLSYLPGFLADKYDVPPEVCAERADLRAEHTAEMALRDTTIGYTAVETKTKNIRLRRGKVHYALLPVWLLGTNWNGQRYTFAMNGQTGKMTGDLPIDRGLYWKHHLAIAAVLAVAAYFVQLFISL